MLRDAQLDQKEGELQELRTSLAHTQEALQKSQRRLLKTRDKFEAVNEQLRESRVSHGGVNCAAGGGGEL